jgi:hypothetical protein
MAELRPHFNNSGSVNIPWETAQDENLSFLARGVLLDALSRPPGWDFSIERMARSCKAKVKGAGRDAVAAACRELEDAGYRRVGHENGEGGRITRWVQFAFRPVPEWAAEAAANRAKRGGGGTANRVTASRATASPFTVPSAKTPGSTVNGDAVIREPGAIKETTQEDNTHTRHNAAAALPDPWGDEQRVCVEIPEGGVRASVSWNVTPEHIEAGHRIITERTHPAALALIADADRARLAEKAGALLARGWSAPALARSWPRTNEATFAPVRVIEPALDNLARQNAPAPGAHSARRVRGGNELARLRARALDIAARFEEVSDDHEDAAASAHGGLWRLTKWIHSADADAITAWLAHPTPVVPTAAE